MANDILISECLTEKDISYYGNDVNNGLENVQSDTESCRASCKAMGAPYFDFNYGGNHGCYCKNSNAGRREVAGVTGGETCQDTGNNSTGSTGKDSRIKLLSHSTGKRANG